MIYLNTIIKKLKWIFERDKDISLYDEFHYIYITIEELIKIILYNIKTNTFNDSK